MSIFLGGTHASFDETDWSLVGALMDSREEFAEAALARLLRDYWAPIFAYIRRSGRTHQEAADLAQEFIATVVLRRGLFHSADRDRGRFRALIKAAVRNFLAEEHRRASARKRSPVGMLRSLSPGLGMEEPVSARSPEAAFDYQLAATAIHRALSRARESCERDDLGQHCRIFEEQVIQPTLLGIPAPGYQELAERYGLRDGRQASNMAAVARRRFQAELRREVSRWVESAEEVDEELARLIEAVGSSPGDRRTQG
ncbi:MAG: RNA polymerase sigma factor [Phycisphaerales bacterium JB038]